MNFKILDIEHDPKMQGYQVGTYDVIVAAWVLYVTTNLAATVRNVRKLFRSRGVLILLEIVEPSILRSRFAFGTLPGWWASNEKSREWSPAVTEGQWRTVLEDNGLQVDLTLPDYDNESCHESSILVSAATDTPDTANTTASIIFVVDPGSPVQAKVASIIEKQLSGHSSYYFQTVSVVNFKSAHVSTDSIWLCLLELDTSYVASLDEVSFYWLQHLLNKAHKVIWVSACSATSPDSADKQMVTGLARSLSTEKLNMLFVTLALEDHRDDPSTWVKPICQVYSATAADSHPTTCELEYRENNGILLISRLTSAMRRNHEIHSKTHTQESKEMLGRAPPVSLTVGNPGLLNSLRFEEDRSCEPDLSPDEVEVESHAIGVSFRDLLVVLGKLDADNVGLELAGIVTRIGANCTTVQVGDRVCAIKLGCFSTRVRCASNLVVKIPSCLSSSEAAAVPITGITAYYSVITAGKLQREDSILIHSAAGGTGQMVLQLALAIGSEIYVTVGTEEKRQLLMNNYGIPASHIFHSRDVSFATQILCATEGRGVDVVVNSLAGEALTASWEIIAPNGRFVELGKADIKSNAKLPMVHFSRNVSFFAFALDDILLYQPQKLLSPFQNVINMLAAGTLRAPSPIHEYPISKLEDAFRYFQSGRNIGKIVITLSNTEVLPVSFSMFC